MKTATCIRGALLTVLLALTSLAGSTPPASAYTCSPPTCCRCLNRCETLYQQCLAEATTPDEELDCWYDVNACEDSCYTGPACGGY